MMSVPNTQGSLEENVPSRVGAEVKRTPPAQPDYLTIRYSEQSKPYTTYPSQLTHYLTENYLKKHTGGKLLDLGCGRGEFLQAFAGEGFVAQGVDREQTNNAHMTAPVQRCDFSAEALPIENDFLDIIFNKSVFEHMGEITPLLRECHRVLKPGGVMISLVPDYRAQWRHFYDDWTHVRPFTLEGLTQCLEGHEFIVDDSRHFRQLPLLWKYPYLRPLADVATLLPESFKRSKWVRFSKEWMLLVVSHKADKRKIGGHDD